MKIVVFNAHGLHCGFLGCYGNEWIATPNIDRLATEGVVFDRHYSHYPSNDPPAGYFFPQSLIENPPPPFPFPSSWKRLLSPNLANFPELLEQGLRHLKKGTSLWIEGPNLAPPWNLSDEMLASYCDEGQLPWPNPPEAIFSPLPSEEILRLQNTYASAITWWDARLGEWLEALAEDEADDTLVILTAGNGFPLAEHEAIGTPRAWLYEELVHVPMIWRLPKMEKAGFRISALTQPVDLFSTFLGTPEGLDLWPLIREEKTEIRSRAYSGLRIGDSIEWAIRTSDWTLLLPIEVNLKDRVRPIQMFVKPEDRWEVNDLRHQFEVQAEELEKQLKIFAQSRPNC